MDMEKSILIMDEVRTLAGQTVHGLEANISVSWYEKQLALKVLEQRARAEAAEAEVRRLRAVCRMALGVVDPSADPVDPMTLWNAIEDVLA